MKPLDLVFCDSNEGNLQCVYFEGYFSFSPKEFRIYTEKLKLDITVIPDCI